MLLFLIGSLGCSSQLSNPNLDYKYCYHWETINPSKINMEIIIHKEGDNKLRVTEINFNDKYTFGTGTITSTTYIQIKKGEGIIVETVNPSNLNITQSKYILSNDTKLLRISNNDTITLKRRYCSE